MLATLLLGAALVVFSTTVAARPALDGVGTGGGAPAGLKAGGKGDGPTNVTAAGPKGGGPTSTTATGPKGGSELWQWGKSCPLVDTLPGQSKADSARLARADSAYRARDTLRALIAGLDSVYKDTLHWPIHDRRGDFFTDSVHNPF